MGSVVDSAEAAGAGGAAAAGDPEARGRRQLVTRQHGGEPVGEATRQHGGEPVGEATRQHGDEPVGEATRKHGGCVSLLRSRPRGITTHA